MGPDDASDLLQAYLAAFRDDVTYCDWPDSDIDADARRVIHDILTGEHGALLPASCVARECGRIIGAAIVVERGPGVALLDAVFVIPAHQRSGLATTLVSAVLSQLHAASIRTLESRYLLASSASRNWHRRFGFAEHTDHNHLSES